MKKPIFYINIVLVIIFLFSVSVVTSTNPDSLSGKVLAAVQQIIGSGESNKLAAFTGANTVGNSIIFDDGTNIGIGTDRPTHLMTLFSQSDDAFAIFRKDGTFPTIFRQGRDNALVIKNGGRRCNKDKR